MAVERTISSSRRDVGRSWDRLGEAITPLGLELNQDKTRVCRVEDGFVFLGYHFGATGRGPAVKAVEALRCRVDELAAAAGPELSELDAVYRGWSNYFGHHPEWVLYDTSVLVAGLVAAHPMHSRAFHGFSAPEPVRSTWSSRLTLWQSSMPY